MVTDDAFALFVFLVSGTQIVTLSPLFEVCGWMDLEEFISPDHATSWMQHPLKLYHYTKKDSWRCTKCQIDNLIFGDECVMCGCRRSRRERRGLSAGSSGHV